MSSTLHITASQILIFDTGPLWELVLYSVVYELGFSRLKTELRHLQSFGHFEKLTSFIASFRRKTTSGHVVAEISGWIRRTEKKGQGNIWGIVYKEFESMGMDEDILKLLEMPRELVAHFGVVDASVLRLGLRFAQLRPRILTVDSELAAECNRAGLDAVHLWQVIS